MTDDDYAKWTVHYGRLRAAAEGATETARTMREKINAQLTGVTAAADHPDHQHLNAASALQTCADAWHRHLHGHADSVHTLGAKLDQTHGSYSHAERLSDEGVIGVPHTQEV